VDIWPDVLPFSPSTKKIFVLVFNAWKWLFKSSVRKADLVMAVSDQFLDEARRYSRRSALLKRFYIGHKRLSSTVAKQQMFTLAYVGNIGHLYDFETLLDTLEQDDLRSRIQLFVIGTGDREGWLLGELKRRHIQHRFYGVVLNTTSLSDILRSCHAGFNGYIGTTASFSYKATTYLAAGLPLLNSMTGDLQRLIQEYEMGENYVGGDKVQLRAGLLRLFERRADGAVSKSERFFAAQLQSDKVLDDVTNFLIAGLKTHQRLENKTHSSGEFSGGKH
jgi:hypothetical protein